MNASCLDEKGRFKSCPYRVYTDEHKAILRGQGDFVSQCFYPERHPTGLLHSADELRQLIRENPALPLLVFAGEEANSGDYPYMSCSYIKAYKGEFLDCTQTVNDCMCYTDRDEFEEAVADSLADGDYTDEEFDALVKKTVAEYDPYWKPCIILNVDN